MPYMTQPVHHLFMAGFIDELAYKIANTWTGKVSEAKLVIVGLLRGCEGKNSLDIVFFIYLTSSAGSSAVISSVKHHS